MKEEFTNYLSSKEAKKKLKVSSCELMHMRIKGKLEYYKKGNTYFYNTKSIR